MSIFQWKSEYSVGHVEIDRQHQLLFQYAARLHDAMLAGEARQVLAPLLDRLVQYTLVHFAHEERLMHDGRYPGYAAHLAEHEALKRQVIEFQSNFDAGKVSLTLDVMNFLKSWLRGHICGTDRSLAAHLAA